WEAHHLRYKPGVELGSFPRLPLHTVDGMSQRVVLSFRILPCAAALRIAAGCRSWKHPVKHSCVQYAVWSVFSCCSARHCFCSSRFQFLHSFGMVPLNTCWSRQQTISGPFGGGR